MPFECKHCGQCCTDDCTQINLSLGDIKRLCSFLGCTVEKLADKIGWTPFEDPERPGHFDVEIGIVLPCGFRKDGRCAVYAARPLNCRMFPSLFLGNVPDDELCHCIDPTHACVAAGIEMTDKEKEQYREYAEFIGDNILSEADDTEEYYDTLGRKKLTVPAEIQATDVMGAREETLKRYRTAEGQVKRDIDPNHVQDAVDSVECMSTDELNDEEKRILG